MLVAALAMAAGAFLPTNLVEDMCQISYAASKLRDLCERHVIDQRRDRFGLPACSIGEPRELVRKSFERGLAMHGLVHWLQHPGTSPDDLLSLSHSLVTIVDVAAESGDWHTVLDIVHVVEPVLIVAGHWQQWRYAEETGLHAAEQLGDDLERAYHLHELGSRALALGSYDQARPLLEKAGSLRSRRGGSGARRVTVHNQGLIARPAWWRQARTAGAAAAVAVAVLIVATVIALARPPLSSHGGSTGPARTASSPTPSATTTLTTVPVPASTPVQSPIQSITPPSPSPSAQAPIIVRITPTAGPEAGGTRVVISGRGFADATRVSFGKVVVTGFTIDSDVQISAVTPAGAGSVDVRVASPAGISLVTKADLFTYVPAPVIKSISPSSGPQGTLVKISGTSFTGTSGASFGTAAARVTFVSDTEIDAVSPAGSGTVDVRVTTPDGTSAINTQTDQFTYTPIQ